MKRLLSAIIVLATLLSCACFAVAEDDGLKDSGLNYTESTVMLKNPHMGYPGHVGMTLKKSGNTVYNNSGFTWYYININAFSSGNDRLPESTADRRGFTPKAASEPISEDALNALDETLSNLRDNGGSCLMRFVYDWNGVPGCEPREFDMIIRHIEQLSEVVGKYSDICLGFECGIIGVFGEMHSSNYCGKEYADRVINAYLDNTPESMILMVRSPAYIMNYLNLTREELADTVTEKGTREYRLSYFNDGYMNTDNDTGTWGDRALDLKFLASQSEHATYGGEYGSAYSSQYLPNNACIPENAIPEMYQTHVNFIRGNVYKINDRNQVFGYDQYTYSSAYEKEWFPDNSAFYGQDCHTFITAHLGYRLVLRSSRLSASPRAGGTLRLSGSIENTGFANILHNPKTYIMLIKDGTVYTSEVNIDAGDFKSCTERSYNLEFNLPSSMPAGEYSVYMRISASNQSYFLSGKSGIQFANNDENIFNAVYGANLLGRINVSAADSVQSASSDIFCPTDAYAVAGGSVTEGAPALICYGSNSTAQITLDYNKDDSLRLTSLNSVKSTADVSYSWYRGTQLVGTGDELYIAELSASDAGVYQLKATASGKTYTSTQVNVRVRNNSLGAYTVERAATCTASGLAVRQSGGVRETKILPLVSHTQSGTKVTPSTCTVRGKEYTDCTVCGKILGFTALDLAPHDYETQTTPPTCTRDGSAVNTCKDCGNVSVETLSALGHDYVYRIEGNKGAGVCSRCADKTEETVYDNVKNPGLDAEDMNGDISGKTSLSGGSLVLVGEGGYTDEYTVESKSSFVTFIFRVTGADVPFTLGKFRTLSSPSDVPSRVVDSNDCTNYYGGLVWDIGGDGVYAFTLSKRVMCQAGNGGFGKITWACFNDPASTKGTATPSNTNANSKLELLGIYDGLISYDVIYTDENSRVLERHAGTYNENTTWSNRMDTALTAQSAYEGEIPEKRADLEKKYTFAYWADGDGNRVDTLMTKVILHPVYTEEANDCPHENVASEVIKAATCSETGLEARICEDCGAVIDSEHVIEKTDHKSLVIKRTKEPTFTVTGEEETWCTDCGERISVKTLNKITNPFGDVSGKSWYAQAVAYVYSRGIFNGMSASSFGPDTSVTRAMFATVLGRLAGVEENKKAETVFADVKRGSYYAGYVDWCNKNGIVNGIDATHFAPDSPITREQMCTMIVRFCAAQGITLKKSEEVDIRDVFADSNRFSKWSADAIEQCRKAGIINGKSKTSTGAALFEPLDGSTRAEVAKVLMKLHSVFMAH